MSRPDSLRVRLGLAAGGTGRGTALERSLSRLREQLSTSAVRGVDLVLAGLSATARRGMFRPGAGEVEVVRDLGYARRGRSELRLDVYRPIGRPGPWPVVLYVHGGGFATLSKDSHWIMAEQFVRQGFLVCTIDYRLAPAEPFPAAIEDTCDAYRWLLDNAEALGGDLSSLVLAGESAGANLVTALSAACCYRRPEPYAAAVFARGRVPDVVVPACGLFQVTDIARLWRRRRMPGYVQHILRGVASAYLRGHDESALEALALADPLRLLESGTRPARSLPAFFIPVGTRDPLLDDTRRLARALEQHGAPVRARYYRGEIHAFHAGVVRAVARECWSETFAFVDQHLHRARRSRSETGDDAESAA